MTALTWAYVVLMASVTQAVFQPEGTTFIASTPHTLQRGQKMATIDLPLDYEISIDIIPTRKIGGWANIFHVTATGTDCCAYGTRIPSLWFYSNTYRLLVVDGHGPNGNDACNIGEQLPEGVPTTVRLTMVQSQVRVYFNDTLKCTEGRRDRREFTNAAVYASDPWYNTAGAQVANFKYRPLAALKGFDTYTFIGTEGFNPIRSTQLGSAFMPLDYAIMFDIIPRGLQSGWQNIIHITGTGTDCCDYGSRIPGIWFYTQSTRLLFVDGHAENGNDVCSITDQLPMNQRTSIRMEMNSSSVFIYYNDTLKCTEARSDRSHFSQARVYASDPWYVAANAEISNFLIDDLSIDITPIEDLVSDLQDGQADLQSQIYGQSTKISTLNTSIGGVRSDLTSVTASANSNFSSVYQAIADLTSDTTTNRTNLRTELMGYITSVNQSVQTVSNNMYTSQLAINSSIQSLRTDLISQNTSLKTLITQGDATVAGTVTTLTTTVNNINTTLASMMVSGDQAVKDMLSPVKDMAMATNQTLQSLQGLLSSKLSALSAFAVGPGSGSGTDSPQITTDGTDMTVDAMNGRLMVGSSQCGATDLCDALKALGDVTSMLSDVGNGV